MTLLISFLAALAAAIVVITIAQTAAAYSNLPREVPMQFNWDGTIRSTGSRPMIWFTVVIQIFVACVMAAVGYAMATSQPGTHGSVLGLSITAVCVNAIIWRVQTMLISSALSGAKRVPMSGFLAFFVPGFALILIAAFAIH